MGGFNTMVVSTPRSVTRFRKNNISMSFNFKFKFKWATKLKIFILFYI